MQPLNQVEGKAYPFGRKNVDTDVIIPAHWLKTITRSGLGRGAFEVVRAEPGNVLIAADYSQIELVLLAHFSQDKVRVDAYRTGRYMHQLTSIDDDTGPVGGLDPGAEQRIAQPHRARLAGIDTAGLGL